MVTARPISNFISAPPQHPIHPFSYFGEAATETMIWFRLRQLAEVPDRGMALFSGTLGQKRARYRSFRAFVRQAEVYWDAGKATRGSAAALPYYYALLQLAKAELLRHVPEQIEGVRINHGLEHRNATGTKIRGDRLRWRNGVFSLLYTARTGQTLPNDIQPKVLSLLSMTPEIGIEMQTHGPTRHATLSGYHSVAADDTQAWSMILFTDDRLDRSERFFRRLLRGYDEVDASTVPNWRTLFSMSSRIWGSGVTILQSKSTFSLAGKPDLLSVGPVFELLMGEHSSAPIANRADFQLVPTLMRSRSFVLPLPLVRYALMFYLSSLVRYQPTKLDPITEGAQSFLMDSVTNELPVYLLGAALDGISGERNFYDPSQLRV